MCWPLPARPVTEDASTRVAVLWTGSLELLFFAAMALDSEATFWARCDQLGMPEAIQQELEAGGINSFATLAFCTPNSGNAGVDDPALMAHLRGLLAENPTPQTITMFRRLAFEAQALAMQDLKSKLERTHDSEPKVLPLQEKLERIRRQQARLGGLSFTAHNQPSHALIDRATQQFDDGVLLYIPLAKCASRYAESLCEKAPASLVWAAA